MLVPLGYAFTHQAAGWRDEHLAALIPALLSVGVLGVAYLLGCELRNRATGLIAALLIAITPMYTHCAGVGYVDLPCGFFYGLSGLFLARYNRTRSWPDALLTGIMAGLAAFTKNSGLLVVLPIALFVVYHWWLARRSIAPPASSVRHVLLMAIGFLVTAGPWYAHTLAMAGVLVAPRRWPRRGGHPLAELFRRL